MTGRRYYILHNIVGMLPAYIVIHSDTKNLLALVQALTCRWLAIVEKLAHLLPWYSDRRR